MAPRCRGNKLAAIGLQPGRSRGRFRLPTLGQDRMRDTSPPGNGTNPESTGAPTAESAGVRADSSSPSKPDAPAGGPKPLGSSSEAPVPSTPGAASTVDPTFVDAGSGFAPGTGSIFGFRKALKSAVHVLTKERSFARDDTASLAMQVQPEPGKPHEPEGNQKVPKETPRAPRFPSPVSRELALRPKGRAQSILGSKIVFP